MPVNSTGNRKQKTHYAVHQKHEKAAPRKKRARKKPPARLKAYWGVFDERFQRIALFEYNERKEAEKAASELDDSKRMSHFVRVVKVAME